MVRNLPESQFTLNCPTQQILDIIADKWSVLVLYCLAYGDKRYTQIQRQIEGISQKVLSQTLRNLERHGLIERKASQETPSSTDYSLTLLGQTLLDPLLELAAWSRVHFAEVAASRDRFDRQNL
jgi:DNA-binding HxlR family transcriptional regulator